MSIEQKTTDEFTLRNDALTEDNEHDLQEFIHIFASKFDLDFNKDVRISIRTKHNEDGANLLIKVAETNTNVVDSRQLNLFEGNGSEKQKEGRGHGKVINIPTS